MEPLKYPDLEELRRKWQNPETSATLQRHMEQYYRYGVIASYLACADSSYPSTYGDHYIKFQDNISRLVRAEVYLVATRLFTDRGDYFLERVNEETGFSVSTNDDEDSPIGTMIPVYRESNSFRPEPKIIPPFTERQAALVIENAHELHAMELSRPLYSIDLRYN